MRSKLKSASLWTIFAFVSSQGLRLFSNLILTRLLLPEMFGLMAMVTVLRVGLYMCSEIGLKVNIIQHENGESPEVLNTAWTMQTIRGVLLWILMGFIALFLELYAGTGTISTNSIYGDERLPLILMVMGSVAFISGFESSHLWLAVRNMSLARLSTLELISQVTGLVVMVSWAWFYPSVWALVAGNIVSAVMKTVMSHYFFKGPRNRFYWRKDIVIEFLHFGKWLFLSALITFFALNGDRLILGGLITAEELGFYSIAFFLAISLKDLVEKLTFNVWYPLLSKTYRENKQHLSEVYYGVRQKLDVVLFSSVGMLYVVAPTVINILYDDRYQQAGAMLQILSITIIASSYRLGSSLLLSMGNPKAGTIAVAVRGLALVLLLPLGYEHYGINGALWSIAINPLFEVPVILWFFTRYKIISWYREVMFLPILGVGYVVGAWFLSLFDLGVEVIK